MNLSAKKKTLVQLGLFFKNTLLNSQAELGLAKESALEELRIELVQLLDNVKHENGWFTKESVLKSLEGWVSALEEDKVNQWLNSYQFSESNSSQKIGVIMAGNIPLVGLHDVLCVLISGNQLYAKISSKDRSLMLLVLKTLKLLNAEWAENITLVEQLKGIDVLIATGSDNSSRYFDYYFKDKKRLIRKNRTSIAILNGDESKEDLLGLSDDVFAHYGLGCRNVTKVYVPKAYDLNHMFNAFFHYKEIGNHNKYGNNYDYNKAVYLLNNVPLIENGFLLMKEDENLHSPVGVLFYEYYNDLEEVWKIVEDKNESIQCIVTKVDTTKNTVPFGKAQSPELWDYADNIDTLDFLMKS